MNIQDYLTVNKFAEKAKITRQAVHKHIKTGNISANRLGREFLIPMSEYERFIRYRVERGVV